MIQLLTELYCSYYRQLQWIFVTDDEQAGREWLEKQLEEVVR